MLRRIIALRLHGDALVLGVLLVASLLQGALSTSLDVGGACALYGQYTHNPNLNRAVNGVELTIVAAALIFWLLDQRRFLRLALIAGNTVVTVELTLSVMLLIVTLNRFGPSNAPWLIDDTLLVLVVNILTFALWYWLIDARYHAPTPSLSPPDFLFPQHAAPAAGQQAWRANFVDYLFLAAMTTTFGPAETIPLSHRAKLLMSLQVTISLVTLTALAGRALSVLGG